MVDVPGFEGFYAVTRDGRVYSRARLDARGHRRNPKWLMQIPDSDGYPRVHLCIGGKKRKWQVHRLVALAYLTNESGLPEVNHIDGVKTNNDVENLEWCTSQQNALHAYHTGLHASRRNALGQFLSN